MIHLNYLIVFNVNIEAYNSINCGRKKINFRVESTISSLYRP